MKPNIVICGAGGIGKAAALILTVNGAMTPQLFIGDINQKALDKSIQWIKAGADRKIKIEGFVMPKDGSNEEMDQIFQNAQVILDCLPGSQAPRIARLAKKFKCHYANLTEYVAETNEIKEIAKDAETGFLLQTGLAPGYINVLACQLYNDFKENYGNDRLQSMKMRVGALSQNALSPSLYAYTWSPIGVATEYVKDAIVVKNFERQSIPSLSGVEKIIIDGEELEDNYTSGGAADLPSAFASKVMDLDYKTLRYPGHYEWVTSFLNDLPEGNGRVEKLDKYMRAHIPNVENDRVIIFAQVTGFDQNGMLRGIEKSYQIKPAMVGFKELRAIQSTTASALCEAAHFLLIHNPKGVILQSQIDPESFMNGPYVTPVYGPY